MAPLQESTLVEAIMAVRGQVDFLWQFFVTVHIALFALLFIYDHAVEGLNAIAKFFAVLGVAAFEWINGNALVERLSASRRDAGAVPVELRSGRPLPSGIL